MRSINLLTLYYQYQTKRRHQFYLITTTSLIVISSLTLIINEQLASKLDHLHLKQFHLLKTTKLVNKTKSLTPKMTISPSSNYTGILTKLDKLFDRHIWLTKIIIEPKMIMLRGDALKPSDIFTLKQKAKKIFIHLPLNKLNINKNHFSLTFNSAKTRNHKNA